MANARDALPSVEENDKEAALVLQRALSQLQNVLDFDRDTHDKMVRGVPRVSLERALQAVTTDDHTTINTAGVFSAATEEASDSNLDQEMALAEAHAEAQARLWATRERAAADAQRSAEAQRRLEDIRLQQLHARLRESAALMSYPEFSGWMKINIGVYNLCLELLLIQYS